MSSIRYKTCKTCGNRNHPDAGACSWCGGALPRRVDRLYVLGMAVILLGLAALMAHSLEQRRPGESKAKLSRIAQTALLR